MVIKRPPESPDNANKKPDARFRRLLAPVLAAFFAVLCAIPAFAGSLDAIAFRGAINDYVRSVRRYLRYIDPAGIEPLNELIQIGAPRAITLDDVPCAYEIPLISSDYSARFIYFGVSRPAVVNFPIVNEKGGRFFLTTAEWNTMAPSPVKLPSVFFAALPESYSLAAFPYYFCERHAGLYEIKGPVLSASQRAKFEFIKFIESVPEKNVPSKKLKDSPAGQADDIKFSPVKTFSYASAFCSDWWHIASSSSSEIAFEKYRDFFSNRPGFGVNPRAADALYQYRAKEQPDVFTFSDYVKDPVCPLEKVHSSLEAYASLLVLPDYIKVPDPAGAGLSYKIDDNVRFYMGDEYISLFENFDATDETIVNALEMHGIVLAGMPYYMNGVPVKNSVKAVVILGSGRSGDSTLFAYKDFEDAPGTYRIAPACVFKEGYCFPHEISAKARYIVKNRRLVIETFNKNGEHIDIDSIEATFPSEGRKARFMKEGTGRYFFQVKKEDFKDVERATLNAKVTKKYHVKGEESFAEINYAIY